MLSFLHVIQCLCNNSVHNFKIVFGITIFKSQSPVIVYFILFYPSFYLSYPEFLSVTKKMILDGENAML